MGCNDIITVPQFKGTCWFNAILMVLFYSQNMKKLVENKTRYFTIEGKNKKANSLRIFHAFVRKMLTMNFNFKKKDNVMNFFEKYSPENVLRILNNYDSELFPFNVEKQCGYHAIVYLEKMFILLNISYKICVKNSTNSKLYNLEKVLKKEEKEEKDTFDIILIIEEQYFQKTLYNFYKVSDEIINDDIKILNKGNIIVGSEKYSIESVILRNTQGKDKHEISGLTCDNKRYLYNGWLSRQIEEPHWLFFKKRKAYPCELSEYDWVNKSSNFCLNSCFLKNYIGQNVEKNTCFKIPTDIGVQIFINDKIIANKFEENKNVINIDFNENDKMLNCLRGVANFSTSKDIYMYDSPNFDKDQFMENLDILSPKLKAMSEMIEKQDSQDMKKEGKLYKHCIYTDLRSSYGIRILGSLMIALGFAEIIDEEHNFKTDNPIYKSFGILTKQLLYNKPVGSGTRKYLMHLFNQRPDNVQGKNVRFIILDKDFKEGIDLFDVKYVHLFEPQLSFSETKQVIGRSTRSCGQSGITFKPNVGWTLFVKIYDTIFQEKIQQFVLFSDTFHEYIIENMGINLKLYNLSHDLEELSIIGSVDYSIVKQKNKKIENGCAKSKNDAFEFSPSQEFIKDYFTPQHFRKGMLLWHSVGTGKTCSAIAVASNTFESQDYTILWVTRASLKGEIWKNIFETICHVKIQELVRDNPKVKRDVRRKMLKYLSNSWSIRPLSYKQFSNMIEGKNQFYNKLLAKNSKEDPLRKTLVIIDEAQKLYNQEGLEPGEKPNMEIFENMVNHSYNFSRQDSVRLLFLSGTPYNNDPMKYINLLNLLKTKNDFIETNYDDFSSIYLNKSGKFSDEGKELFLKKISGHISYLDQSNNARKFAQPQIHHVHTKMSIIEHKDSIERIKDLSEIRKSLDKEIKSDIADLDKWTKKKPNKMISKEEILTEIKNMEKNIEEVEIEFKKVTDEIERLEKLVPKNNHLSQEYSLMKRCLNKY